MQGFEGLLTLSHLLQEVNYIDSLKFLDNRAKNLKNILELFEGVLPEDKKFGENFT
jgi:hypothetical protein